MSSPAHPPGPRPGDAHGPCQAGDILPPSLWLASVSPCQKRSSRLRRTGGRAWLREAADRPRSPPSRPFTLVLYRGPPGLSQHPPLGAGREGDAASVPSWVQQWPQCTPNPGRAHRKPPGPGCVSPTRIPSGRGLVWPPQCRLLSVCRWQQDTSDRQARTPGAGHAVPLYQALPPAPPLPLGRPRLPQVPLGPGQLQELRGGSQGTLGLPGPWAPGFVRPGWAGTDKRAGVSPSLAS